MFISYLTKLQILFLCRLLAYLDLRIVLAYYVERSRLNGRAVWLFRLKVGRLVLIVEFLSSFIESFVSLYDFLVIFDDQVLTIGLAVTNVDDEGYEVDK